MPDPRYIVISLLAGAEPVHLKEANDALAKAEQQGYSKLESVYSVHGPNGTSTVYAVMSK